ncbi:MAG TPA: hypothetical protein VGN14_10705 [Candidatus Elarobacter sp.]|jgi:hypothetical protein
MRRLPLTTVIATLALSACAHAGSGLALPPTGSLSSDAATMRSTPAMSVAAPGERLDALPGMPQSGTLAERLNALPGVPQPMCVQPQKGDGNAGCQVQQNRLFGAKPNPNTPYAQIWGYKPRDLAAAYAIPASGNAGTVAIVDAYDDPAVESDLAVYRSAMGLPACTSANRCFRKVAVQGTPNADAGWSAEIALDVEMVSAACAQCSIVLVEAQSASMHDLAKAVGVAASYHPDAISNSYYAPEDPSQRALERTYAVSGSVVTVAAGDGGFGTTYPASSPNVVAVAATSLLPDVSARGWGEGVWSGTGSGCSTIAAKPAWQTDKGCAGRTVADLAVVGDPRTGVAMYTSIAPAGVQTGWIVAGGTSVGAPFVAGLYALAGNAKSIVAPQRLWTSRAQLNPITVGSNGTCPASIAYLCTATTSYSGPGGNGSPRGLAAF